MSLKLGDETIHALVQAQRFARSEFERCLDDLTDQEARFRPTKADSSQMNCISWIICHMAYQEWLFFVSGIGGPASSELAPFATGGPASEPPLSDALAVWREATAKADKWLAQADHEQLQKPLQTSWPENLGTALMRNTFHYWFHCGEVNAIRQLLGHHEIMFVGVLNDRLEYPLS